MFKNYFRYQEAMEDADGGGSGDDEVDTNVNEADEASDSTDDGESSESTPDWSPDWRQKLAGDNEKLLKRFERYASPVEVGKALIAAQDKIRGGELVTKLSDKPTDEELAQFRKDNGIPESKDGYEIDLGNGRVIGDEDKELVDAFLESAHAKNMTPAQVNATLNTYYDLQEQQIEAINQQDLENSGKGEDELRVEWGPEYKRNINAIYNELSSKMEPDQIESLWQARMPDGVRVGDSPEVIKALLGMVLEANPMATVVPSGGGDMGKSIADEIKSIEETMRTDRKAYNRDEAMQQRYRDLLAAQAKMK